MWNKLFNRAGDKMDKIVSDVNKVKNDFNTALTLAKNQRDILVSTQAELEKTNKSLETQNKLISDMAHAAGGLICRKDKNGKYLFVNEYQCSNFFKMATPCLPDAIGKTDIDLINEYIERTGKQNTFVDICIATDNHCKKQVKRCSYIEIGIIGEQQVILKMIKTPMYNDKGEDDGVVCFGWDVSCLGERIKEDIETGILDGSIEQLCDNVYWIKKISDHVVNKVI